MNEIIFLASGSQPNLLTSTQALAGLSVVVLSIGIAWGALKQSVRHINEELSHAIRPDLKNIRERLAVVETKVDGLANARSPLSLTDKGQKLIRQSGLKTYIDQNQDILRQRCGQYGELKTPYDVQQAAISLFDKYEFPEAVENKLKTCAFNQGVSFGSIRHIGGLYLRDICLDNQSSGSSAATPPKT